MKCESSPYSIGSPVSGKEAKLKNVTAMAIGHVDSGKSTLLGHLLLLLEQVSNKQLKSLGINKYGLQNEGGYGKRSCGNAPEESVTFAEYAKNLSWILDETEDERLRGLTTDFHVKYFETKRCNVTVLDTPGHIDLTENVISAAMIADIGILVADVTDVRLSSSKIDQRPSLNHVQLVRIGGVRFLIVAINKMDKVNWSKEKFDEARNSILSFLCGSQAGFQAKNIIFIPVCALTGENIIDCERIGNMWNTCETLSLFSAIDNISDLLTIGSSPALTMQWQERENIPLNNSIIANVVDIWNTSKGISVSCKLLSGVLKSGMKLILLPGSHDVTVQEVKRWKKLGDSPSHDDQNEIMLGEFIPDISLSLSSATVSPGSVLCHPAMASAVKISKKIYAKLTMLDCEVPLVKGQSVVLIVHSAKEPAIFGKFLALLSPNGNEVNMKNPKYLSRGNRAIVRIDLTQEVCYQCGSSEGIPMLSRVVVIREGTVVAAGFAIDS